MMMIVARVIIREQQGKFSQIVTRIVIMISDKQGKFSLLTCSFSE